MLTRKKRESPINSDYFEQRTRRNRVSEVGTFRDVELLNRGNYRYESKGCRIPLGIKR